MIPLNRLMISLEQAHFSNFSQDLLPFMSITSVIYVYNNEFLGRTICDFIMSCLDYIFHFECLACREIYILVDELGQYEWRSGAHR